MYQTIILAKKPFDKVFMGFVSECVCVCVCVCMCVCKRERERERERERKRERESLNGRKHKKLFFPLLNQKLFLVFLCAVSCAEILSSPCEQTKFGSFLKYDWKFLTNWKLSQSIVRDACDSANLLNKCETIAQAQWLQ